MKARWKVGVGALAAVALGLAPVLPLAARSSELSGSPPQASARVLEIYVRSPVLVRAGEPVRLPVEVVCATAHGDPCASRITLASRSGSGAWRMIMAPGVPSLQFDLSAAASRALGSKAERHGELLRPRIRTRRTERVAAYRWRVVAPPVLRGRGAAGGAGSLDPLRSNTSGKDGAVPSVGERARPSRPAAGP